MRCIQILPIIALCACTFSVFAQSASFTDIYANYPYTKAVASLKQEAIISGFADGTFRPDRTVNRAEAVKLIASVVSTSDEIKRCIRDHGMPYTDVHRSDWFAPFVCMAAAKHITIPPADAQFRPADRINLAETSMLLARSYALQISTNENPWYASAIRSMADRNAIPQELYATGENVTRGQLGEILWRLKHDVRTNTSHSAEELLQAQCNWFVAEDIPHVDGEELSRQWFEWINRQRASENLPAYTYDKQLTRSALLWSRDAIKKGAITHNRTEESGYYDYAIITDWFAGLGLVFENINRSTFTENIGWGVYRCSDDDCTRELVKAVRTTFEMYMSEKMNLSRPHYNSLMSKDFTRMGVGIVVDPVTNTYYLTAHYSTEITSNPDPVCP